MGSPRVRATSLALCRASAGGILHARAEALRWAGKGETRTKTPRSRCANADRFDVLRYHLSQSATLSGGHQASSVRKNLTETGYKIRCETQ